MIGIIRNVFLIAESVQLYKFWNTTAVRNARDKILYRGGFSKVNLFSVSVLACAEYLNACGVNLVLYLKLYRDFYVVGGSPIRK